jgi:membrane protease YdiL (CAAX protease family)
MTAIAHRRAAWIDPLAVGFGLAVAVTARWLATANLVADPIVVGLGFGIGLMALGAVGRTIARVPRPSGILLGVIGACLLVGVALLPPAASGEAPAIRILAFGPWAAATVLVAAAEEAVLRGALFDGLVRLGGPVAAIVLTSVAFALMHVPSYGWHVVPLDLGAGLLLGGLRLLSGGIAAPAIAHAVADLATWWL